MTTDIFAELRNASDIVVYGAHIRLTDIALLVLSRIDVKPSCIVDGRRELAGGDIDGIPIITPEDLLAKHHDAHVVLCPSNEYWSVYDFLWENGMSRLFGVSELVMDVNLDDPALSSRARSTIEIALDTQRRMIENRRGGVYLTQADFILTEHCTLNCRYCCNLMPYFKNKRDYPAEEILRSAHRLAAASDRIINAVLVGGEPLLYRRIDDVITELCGMQMVERVSIYTNGTILPNEPLLQIMKKLPKLHLIISDYGPLSTKAAALGVVLERNGISHDTRRFTGDWRDMGDFTRRMRSAIEQRKVFRGCWTKNCTAILGGRLFRCPRAAFGARLGVVPDPIGDAIDLLDESMPAPVLREKLQSLLFGRDFILACDYCDGMDIAKPPIDPAEQQPWGVIPANFSKEECHDAIS